MEKDIEGCIFEKAKESLNKIGMYALFTGCRTPGEEGYFVFLLCLCGACGCTAFSLCYNMY